MKILERTWSLSVAAMINILLLVMPAVSSGQSYRIFKGDTINRTDKAGKKQGIWRRYYENDQLFSETYFKNNIPSSETRTWYRTGELQAVLTYDESGKSAMMESFWPDGSPKASGKYVNKKKHGRWIYYHQNDTISSVENYDNGVEEGEWTNYYPSGKVSERFSYSNGLKNGKYTSYFSNGSKKMETTYVDGTINGPCIHFHMNGKPMSRGDYENGLQQGKWIFMSESGTVDSTKVYIRGFPEE